MANRALILFLLLFNWLAFTVPAYAFTANQCAADRFGADLNCTANDVSITGMEVVGDTTSCVGETNITLDLKMTINFQTPDRYDVGIFISNDGKTPQTRASGGGAKTCSVSVLPNSSPFLDLDGPSDTCGDGNGSIGGGSGAGIHYMSNVTVPCQSATGAGGNLYVPFVVSWDNQSSPSGGMCTSNTDPVPNTKSKCNAPTVIQGSIGVLVLPSISKTDGLNTDGLNKDTVFSGDSTTYTVTITNTTKAALSRAVFTDPAVSGITANSISCSAAGGATCPASSTVTVAAMQGAGIEILALPIDGSVTFTIGATLTGSPGNTRTNTAVVTVGSQSNSASDTNTIVDSIIILPITQAKTGDKGAPVSYSYKLYNFGAVADTVSLAVSSSKGWAVSSPTSVTVPAGDWTTVDVTVPIHGGASIGTVDTTTLTATSGVNPAKTSVATAVTTVTSVLTLTPNNAASGGAGSAIYYAHRVQSNASSSKDVSLTPVLTGSCAGWSSALFASDKTTALASPVNLAANGGYRDFILKVSIPVSAVATTSCMATLTAQYTSGTASAVSVTDDSTVKILVLYEDTAYTSQQSVFPAGNNVYAMGYGLGSSTSYEYRWYNSSGVEVCTPRELHTTGTTFPDTCTIPTTGPLGTWTAQIWNRTSNSLADQSFFYVGPDHLKASYTGSAPTLNSDTVVNLALHDKLGHVVPFDPSGNLVKGSPTDTEGPLMITVTVSGSAQIVSTTLGSATITGQSVTGKLDSTTGTATLTISDSVAEIVTVTPVSYKGLLYGSPVRDEVVSLSFSGSALNHVRLDHTGSAITCLGEQVTVNACNTADVSGVCTANTSGLTGNVIANSASSLPLATVPFTIPAGSSSVTVTVPVSTAQTVTFATGSLSVTPSASPAWTCWNGSAASCSNVFSDAGFVVASTTGGAEATIPTQTAGISSTTYYLRAVKTDKATKVCEAGLVGANSVNFAYECVNPATCFTSNLMSVNGGSNTSIARYDSGQVSSTSGTPVSLTFDANGNAPFTFNYGDVGQLKLWANKTVSGATLAGASNSFVVKPFRLALSGVKCSIVDAANCGAGALAMTPTGDNPAATDSAGGAFIRAGDAFAATVTATAFGVTGVTVTPSFGREVSAEGVTLTRDLAAPLGGAAGGLGGTFVIPGALFQSGTKGVATVSDLTWNEVGIINLTPTLTSGNYLGSGENVSSPSVSVGRFIPHHFLITPGTLVNRQPAACGAASTFTYAGEEMQLKDFKLTARNGLTTPSVTTNYAGTFAKFDGSVIGNFGLAAVDLTDVIAPVAATAFANGAGAGQFGLVSSSGSWAAGVGTFSANVKLNRAAASDGPYESFRIGVAPVDGDSVTVRTVDKDLDISAPADALADKVGIGSSIVRFGRLWLGNVYGSEKLNLSVPFETQYWNGFAFVRNSDDSCTRLLAGNVAMGNRVKLSSNPSIDASSILTTGAGVGKIVLNAPNAAGSVDLVAVLGSAGSPANCASPTVTGGTSAAAAYLSAKWCGASYDRDPTARATFGIFGSSLRKGPIYTREIF